MRIGVARLAADMATAKAWSPFPVVDASAVPVVTGEQMREIDRLMVEVMGINLLQMMENAGRSLAEVALARFEGVWRRHGTWSTAESRPPSWPRTSRSRPGSPNRPSAITGF